MLTDENWSLPLAVSWPEQNDVAEVQILTTIPLLNIQHTAMTAKLNSISSYRNGAWWILRADLNVVARQVTDDVEQYIVWRPMDARVKFRTPEHPDRDEFFAEYARTGIINDPVKAEIIFVSFCKHMLSWMLNEQRPVHLGFCDLHAVPFRPNWKQLIFQSQRSRQNPDKSKVWSDKDLAKISVEELIKRGTGDALIDPRLLFWNKKDGHMYWSIEARPRSMWWRMVKAVEMAKRRKRSGVLYFRGICDTMKRFIPHGLDIYASHIQQVVLPFVRLAAHCRASGRSFKTDYKHLPVDKAPVLPSGQPAAHVSPKGASESIEMDDVSTAAFVSEMSDIQRRRIDLRDARHDLLRSVANEAGRSAE